MTQLRSWSLAVVLLVSLVWVGLWAALLAGPWIQAGRWVRKTVEESGIAAISFGIGSVLWRVSVVFVPPLVLFVAWLMARQAV